MIKNYFKTALRSLIKNKGFTAINVLGLALGLAACLLIVLYVADELSYDRFNANAGRIYRVDEDLKLGDNAVKYAVTMPPLAQTLKQDFPEVEDAVRLKPVSFHIKKGTQVMVESNALFADASVFNVFTLPFLYGNKTSALTEPNTVVISASAARKYFNKLNVVGQFLTVDDNQKLKITGVIQDMPKQSHFYTDFLESMSTLKEASSDNWLNINYVTYVLLHKGTDPKRVEAKFPQLLRQYCNAQLLKVSGMNFDAFHKSGNHLQLSLTALTNIHLNSNLTGELGVNGSAQYVYIFSAIALFILVLACVNFMNLSTARSSNRAREVGVRKVLGSPRKHLIAQFLTESTLITLAGTIIAFIIAKATLPAFNNLSGKNISINTEVMAWLVPALLIQTLVIGCLAGAYPAMFLSGFQPVKVLKGKWSAHFKGSRLRSTLVVFQFAVSVFLIIGTLVVYDQLKFIQNRDIGYNRNHVLIIKNTYELRNQASLFKREIKQLPGVINATLTGYLPTSGYRSNDVMYKSQSKNSKETLFPQMWTVDHDYIKTLGMQLSSGRNFSDKLPTDSNSVVINETAARFFGTGNAANKKLYDGSLKPYTVIGVVKDFNFSSLRDNVTPMVLFLGKNTDNLAVKVKTSDLPTLLSAIKNKWAALSPNNQFNYSFMDADFDATYRSEQRMGRIFIIFTSLAIIIACLGLFGLSAYDAEQRHKEIGIRKVLGASVATIVRMLSLDFIKLVGIAILIASPVAWLVMHQWLQDFAYRITVSWFTIAVAASAATLIALTTIGFQTLKAAMSNPVDSLKSE